MDIMLPVQYFSALGSAGLSSEQRLMPVPRVLTLVPLWQIPSVCAGSQHVAIDATR
jgi:hypothetical protein